MDTSTFIHCSRLRSASIFKPSISAPLAFCSILRATSSSRFNFCDLFISPSIMDSHDKKVRILACNGGSWEAHAGVMKYRPSSLMRRALELPFDTTYSQLRTYLAEKFSFNRDYIYCFKMSYKFPPSSSEQKKPVVVKIADDEDVKIFIDIANEASHGPVTLYIYRYDLVND
ncbi:hypothetical protein L1987_30600 [Smallanthus sonchifolius]|uniref:Uncharacterized protein n=1 Tax=Smallanthus sonchifolius TaxID=185202 RepID=A0ACB9I425_9ASTR|nr:hypothetical protein L1987_30600 [Smallanthus sonchifolius]